MNGNTDHNGLRIVVLGYIVRAPYGGMGWSNLQYMRGLRDLGHDVYFVEDSDDYPSCYDPDTQQTGIDPSYGLRFAQREFSRIGLRDRWAFYDAHRSTWHGPCADRVLDICARADLLMNLAGANPWRPWFESIEHRVFVDEDPGFTQVRHLSDANRRDLASKHTAFYSFAENIGTADCSIPDDGFSWNVTRQPIVIDMFNAAEPAANERFTTIMAWDSYPDRVYEGVRYGTKSRTFPGYEDIPSRVATPLEIALGNPSAPRKRLRGKGWVVVDPLRVAIDVRAYESYIRHSKGEFSVAKEAYVITRSGWFSERSVCYLAVGRPVVTQDTGFSAWLREDRGLVSFRSPDEAVAALEEVVANYESHRHAARELVTEYFDHRVVLSRLIDSIYSAGGARTGIIDG